MPAITKSSIERLRKRIVDLQVRGKDFTLTSGAQGQHYIDIKGACLEPDTLYTIAGTFVKWMQELGLQVAGGAALGADPIVGAMVIVSALKPFSYPIKGFIVRKNIGDLGADNIFEGHSDRGAEAVIVEDVLSMGNSTLHAARMAQSKGMKVKNVFVVVDKKRGGAQKLVQAGFNVRSIFTLASLNLPK